MSTAENEERGKLRVVLDSNVYVSAFVHPGGLCFEIWSQAVNQRYRLITSPAIVNEIGGVLRKKFGWEEERITRHLRLIPKAAEIVHPSGTIRRITDDEDDNRILECAVAGRADLIVSGDQHLRRLRTFQGIAIVHPTDFRRTLED